MGGLLHSGTGLGWPCGLWRSPLGPGLSGGLLGAGRGRSGWRPEGLCARSPADCLLILAYKDRSERARGLPERSGLVLEDVCGLEPGLPHEGLAHTLAIVRLSQAVMLGFDSREAMCAWDARIRHALGEGEWCQPGSARQLRRGVSGPPSPRLGP